MDLIELLEDWEPNEDEEDDNIGEYLVQKKEKIIGKKIYRGTFLLEGVKGKYSSITLGKKKNQPNMSYTKLGVQLVQSGLYGLNQFFRNKFLTISIYPVISECFVEDVVLKKEKVLIQIRSNEKKYQVSFSPLNWTEGFYIPKSKYFVLSETKQGLKEGLKFILQKKIDTHSILSCFHNLDKNLQIHLNKTELYIKYMEDYIMDIKEHQRTFNKIEFRIKTFKETKNILREQIDNIQ